MKEYRIVATKDQVRCRDGKKFHYDESTVYTGGKGLWTATYDDFEKAKYALEQAIKDAKEYEEKHNANLDADSYEVHYTNIRLQSREVTEWEDDIIGD